MSQYSLAHLSDSTLLAGTHTLVGRDRVTTAELLAHLAEVDARKLYLPEAYPSMFAWCVGSLRLSEDGALRRIRAARYAHDFPALLPMLADGRLNLSAVLALGPVLSPANAADLLAAAAGLAKSDLERLLAERFPRTDSFSMVMPAASSPSEVAPAPLCDTGHEVAPAPVHVPVTPVSEQHFEERARLAPIAGGRFTLSVTLTQETCDALRYAQSLLGHSVPDGDLAQVLDRALRVLVERLEKQRFGKCSCSRQSRTPANADSRHIPSAIRRLVWERDGGQCTFTSEHGHRCECRTRLEFDHIEPLARGGASTPSNLRLRCRAHNQHAAEHAFGREFMTRRREEAKRRAAAAHEARRAQEAQQTAERERQAALQVRRDELIPFLRHLGYSLPAARLASAVCDSMPDASLEDRLRAALKRLMPNSVRIERPSDRDAA